MKQVTPRRIGTGNALSARSFFNLRHCPGSSSNSRRAAGESPSVTLTSVEVRNAPRPSSRVCRVCRVGRSSGESELPSHDRERHSVSSRPCVGKPRCHGFHLLHDQLDGLGLLVRGVAEAHQESLDRGAELRPDVVAHCPVGTHVPPHR